MIASYGAVSQLESQNSWFLQHINESNINNKKRRNRRNDSSESSKQILYTQCTSNMGAQLS
jgi:hypothetical protein